MQVSRSIVLGLLAELRRQGIPRDSFLREAGISEHELSSTTCDLALAVRAVRAGYRLTRDPALALHLGSHAPMRMLDVVGEVLLHCPTMRVAIAEIERYMALIAPAGSFRLEERQAVARLSFETRFTDPDIARVVSEIAMAFVLRFARHFVGESARPIEVFFAYPAPFYARAYEQLFECPVTFGAEQTAICFDAFLIDEPQPFVDEPVRCLLKVRADELLRQTRDRRTLAARVRYSLEHEACLSSVSMARTAQHLGMSESGLRRKLREENTSWTLALDDARRELALRKLRNPEIPIKQIADETGFSEPSAFHRAFRRWTGSTPARFRAEAVTERLRNSA